MTDKEKYVFENILARRSVRQFVKGKQVEKDKIQKLLEAAMAAPSACNIQPWEFIVITEPSMLRSIEGVVIKGEFDATLMIAVCGYAGFIPWEGDNGAVDCAAAIENMLLTATAMDLGSLWVGGYDGDAVNKLLGIPDDVHLISIVYFGYPVSTPEPRTQYTDLAVHWEKFDTGRGHTKREGCIM